ncbi:MAG: FkbM family methyltransferase [SAR324 cluster bacterium]|nr:FkbM family methyltransferase [SAR324 cluster bacterium]
MLTDLHRLLQEITIVFRLLPLCYFFSWFFGGIRCFKILLKTRSVGILDQLLGSSFEVTWNHQRLRFDQLDFGVVREIYGHLCYAKPGELKNARHILDLGANSGAFTVFAALEAPEGQIEAIEIQSHLVRSAKLNVEQNHCEKKVNVRCAAVGSAHNQWVQTVLKEDPQIEIFDIENYISKVGTCDFLKCDVEGGEFSLFAGNLDWTRAVKKMALEYHPTEGDVDRLEQTLKKQGFDVKRVDHSCLGYLYCSRNKTS